MTTQQHLVDEMTAYQETVNGLLRLHRFTVEKQDGTAEYHELCAELAAYWEQMTPLERERAGGLSQDLYTVSDPPPTELMLMTPAAYAELAEVDAARGRGDWDLTLALLRKLEMVLPPPVVAHLRGAIWDGLDGKQVALVFYERAHQFAPENGTLLAAFDSVLK